MKRFEVWDLPLRLFHWTLLVLVTISFGTAWLGGIREMDLHMLSGYGVLTLILFRIAWGFAGNRHARFASFLRGPGAAYHYLRALLTGTPPYHVGHNPAAAWMVVGMLLLLLVQTGTGLFSTDDIFIEGPLRHLVGDDASGVFTRIHKINYILVLALIALHLGAVAFYQFVKKVNLTWPMITGKKDGEPEGDLSNRGSPWLALPIVLIAGAAVYALVNWV